MHVCDRMHKAQPRRNPGEEISTRAFVGQAHLFTDDSQAFAHDRLRLGVIDANAFVFVRPGLIQAVEEVVARDHKHPASFQAFVEREAIRRPNVDMLCMRLIRSLR